MINFPSPLTGLSGAGAGGMTPAGSSGGNHHSFVAIVLKDVANYATR